MKRIVLLLASALLLALAPVTPSYAATFTSTVTIRLSPYANSIHGRVSSSHTPCTINRGITVYELTPTSAPYADAVTDSSGRWNTSSVPGPVPAGKYRAYASRQVARGGTCLRAASPTLTVR